ncbi:MAG: hypothetical protein JSR39_04190 [Verrucomicrobia bacterium]|nr:hypothetical protein [Verrucomicrobiota bacterium]
MITKSARLLSAVRFIGAFNEEWEPSPLSCASKFFKYVYIPSLAGTVHVVKASRILDGRAS